ncbi:MAG: response regulator transcription factor [Acidobacteria bacterium]|nr:response regulator transcription factor [Acidobacteriota bacterium]
MRILLVDDNPKFLEAASRFLSVVPEVEIVACVFSGREAVEQSAQLQPDLVLMDLVMPGMDGLAATREIKAQPDAPRVIIVTLHKHQEYRAAAEAVGADGFLSKSEFGAQLLLLIRALFT